MTSQSWKSEVQRRPFSQPKSDGYQEQNHEPDVSRQIHHSNHTLVEKALSGNERAYEELFSRNRREVLGLCLKYSNWDETQAQDMCQEAFITAFRKLRNLRNPSRFSSWIMEIAKDLCISYNRKQMTHRRRMEEFRYLQESIIDQDQTWTDEELEIIRSLMSELEGNEVQKTIRLFYIEGMRTPEIAKIQGISQTAVTTRLSRFRGRFRIRLVKTTLGNRLKKK